MRPTGMPDCFFSSATSLGSFTRPRLRFLSQK
jgi:hypothetical protein